MKDINYYLCLDLDALALRLPCDREERVRSPVFADIIMAIVVRLNKGIQIETKSLLAWLGAPDTSSRRGQLDVWEYRWIGEHGQDEYASRTPFLVNGPAVLGIDEG